MNNSLIDGTTIDVNVTAMAASVVTAAAIATDAVDADALASDAVTEIRSLATGTSDAGGSTTTMVDAARTEADDVWNGAWILFTSGAVSGQCRLIVEFVASTDTITFAPETTASIGSGITYEILPNGAVDLQSWVGTANFLPIPNSLVSSNVPAFVNGIANDTITAASIAAGAITSSEAPNLDAAVSTRATPAQVNSEVLDVLNIDTFSEPGQEAPPATTTLIKKIGYLYKFLRNKITQTSTTLSVFADDAATVDQKATVSDDATTYTRGEIGTGP